MYGVIYLQSGYLIYYFDGICVDTSCGVFHHHVRSEFADLQGVCRGVAVDYNGCGKLLPCKGDAATRCRIGIQQYW